ncbi:cobalamin B12-binding domain-containing protein [Williamwhitmania taraxaci]|nr:B12-binding domain-containing protein [Williamwhitmania taraxaci]
MKEYRYIWDDSWLGYNLILHKKTMIEPKEHAASKEFLALLISGNRLACSEFIHEYSKKQTIQELYEDIIKKALYEVGELWENNKISVATEHLASSIVEAILNELYGKVISEKRINKKVVVACIESEFHQIGIKMISDVFEMNGWNSYFLGANTPIHDLIEFTRKIKPDFLAISLSIYF